MDTLDEVVQSVLSSVDEENAKRVVKEHPDASSFTAMYHHGVGTGIRNQYNLWSDESKALRRNIWDNMTETEQAKFNNHWANWAPEEDFTGENMHADDASSVIMDRLWEAIKEKYKND